jgi:hypothetical protein
MRHSPTLFTAVLVFLFLRGIYVVHGDDQPTSKDLGKIETQVAFQDLPGRWVVERTFAWLGDLRRLSKDYEELVETVWPRFNSP